MFDLGPIAEATPAIRFHTFAALAAFGLGVLQFARAKGTPSHRIFGFVWVALMMAVAASSFAISTIRQFGPFSLIHVLSAWTLVITPYAVLQARRGNIAAHRQAMISLFAGALVLAGLFTLAPGRILHDVVFGR